MLSSASFLRTASSGSFDSNGVKTPTRIAPLSPPKSPAILSQVAYVTLRACALRNSQSLVYAPRTDSMGRMLLRQPRRLLFLSLLFWITAALASAQTDPSMPPPPREKKIHLKH